MECMKCTNIILMLSFVSGILGHEVNQILQQSSHLIHTIIVVVYACMPACTMSQYAHA